MRKQDFIVVCLISYADNKPDYLRKQGRDRKMSMRNESAIQ